MSTSSKFVALTHPRHQHLHSLTPIQLPCPQTGRSALYLHDSDHQHLFEIQRVTGAGRKASWLINDTVYKDGTVRHITHVDPLFIALPIVEHASVERKFRTLDDIFSIEAGSAHSLLRLNGFQAQLAHLCDVQQLSPDIHVYRLNKDKALDWLQKKVDQLVPSFGTVPLLQSSVAEALEKTSTEQEKTDLYRQEAVYLLSRYLSPPWFKALLDHLGLKEIEEDQEMNDLTNSSVGSLASFLKAAKSKPVGDDATAAKKRKPEVPRSLRNVNTRGMSSLTSYFSAKK